MVKTSAIILIGVALLVVAPAPARAQAQKGTCMVTGTTVFMTNSAMSYTNVAKRFPTTVTCTGIMYNVFNCVNTMFGPGVRGCPTAMTMGCNALRAIADTMSGNPRTCSAMCGGCGTVTIDNSDGLPVELLEFRVSDDETPADEAPADEAPPPNPADVE